MTEIPVEANEQDRATLPTQQPKVPRVHQHRHFPSSSRGRVPRPASEAAQVVPKLPTQSRFASPLSVVASFYTRGFFSATSSVALLWITNKSERGRRWQQLWPRCIYSLCWRCTPRTVPPPRNYKIFMVVAGLCAFAA